VHVYPDAFICCRCAIGCGVCATPRSFPSSSPLVGPGYFELPRTLFFDQTVHGWYFDILTGRMEEYGEHRREPLPLVR